METSNWITLVGIVAAAFSSSVSTPLSNFLLTARYGKLEKNIALRASLPKSERSRELDFLINEQTKSYVEKNIKNTTKPHWFFVLVITVLNALMIFFALVLVQLFTPLNLSFFISVSPDAKNIRLEIAVVFLLLSGLRYLISRKTQEIEFNYGFYGAYLSDDSGRMTGIETPQDVILRIPKYSLTKKYDDKEVVSYQYIYLHDEAAGMMYCFKRDIHRPQQATQSISIFSTGKVIEQNEILIFKYSYEKSILADEILQSNKRIFVLPHYPVYLDKNEQMGEQREILSRWNPVRIEDKIELSNYLNGTVVSGRKRTNGRFYYWKQTKENFKPNKSHPTLR